MFKYLDMDNNDHCENDAFKNSTKTPENHTLKVVFLRWDSCIFKILIFLCFVFVSYSRTPSNLTTVLSQNNQK